MDESRLIGMEIMDGWVIEKRRSRLPDASGGEHSLSYIARHASGGQAFVKILDPTIDEGAPDPIADLKLRVEVFDYERQIVERCNGMSRIVRAIGDGSIQPVFRISFSSMSLIRVW